MARKSAGPVASDRGKNRGGFLLVWAPIREGASDGQSRGRIERVAASVASFARPAGHAIRQVVVLFFEGTGSDERRLAGKLRDKIRKAWPRKAGKRSRQDLVRIAWVPVEAMAPSHLSYGEILNRVSDEVERAGMEGSSSRPSGREKGESPLRDFLVGRHRERDEIYVFVDSGSPAKVAATVSAFIERGWRCGVALPADEESGVGTPRIEPIIPAVKAWEGFSLDDLGHLPPTQVVLLRGEPGAGKSHMARMLHERWTASSGPEQPFRRVNLASVPPDLASSQLFGHVKGAFTGATKDKRGYFEEARGGTLLLDEIGAAPLEVQSHLLLAVERVDFEKGFSFYRVGDQGTERTSTFHLVCATNEDLEAAAAQGRFRADLLARISSFEVVLPPLRERRWQIVPLYLEHFERMGKLYGQDVRFAPTRGAVRRLWNEALDPAATWSGNVRDVVQSVERLCLRVWARARTGAAQGRSTRARHKGGRDEEIYEIAGRDVEAELQTLRRRWSRGKGDGAEVTGAPGLAARAAPYLEQGNVLLEAVERALIDLALEKEGGNKAAVGRLLVDLGVYRATSTNPSDRIAKRIASLDRLRESNLRQRLE